MPLTCEEIEDLAVPLFEWSPRYNVGIDRFDHEHEHLFTLMNELHDATRVRQERTVLAQIFREIVDYTDRHFSAEEEAMESYGYDRAAEHKREHDQLRSKNAELMARYQSGHGKIGIDMVNFLLRWWTDHILRTDKEYSAFFSRHEA